MRGEEDVCFFVFFARLTPNSEANVKGLISLQGYR